MPLTIKTARELFDDVISQDVGITEDSDVLFAVGELANGGTIYLAIGTNVATRTVGGEEQASFFFGIDTVPNVLEQQRGMINSDHKEAGKEES